MTENLTEILAAASKSASELLSLLEDTQKKNERLNIQLNAQKRKYKALESVLETLKTERLRDRETIAKWQSWILTNGYEGGLHDTNPPKSSSQRVTNLSLENNRDNDPASSQITREMGIDELPTSTGSNPGCLQPNFNNIDRHSHRDPAQSQESNVFINSIDEPPVPLSQRLLPTSIDLDELQGNSFSRSQDSIISSSPPPPESELETTPQHSQVTSFAPATKKAKREIHSPVSGTRRVKIDESASVCEDRLIWLREVISAQWHPSDFKLNESFSQEIAVVPSTQPFDCKQGRRDNCQFCRESSLLLDEIGILYAESRPNSGPESQETPAGYWRVDYLNSSQVRADKRQNEETHQFEGKQRLALTLLQKKFSFRDKMHQKLQLRYMN